MCIFERSFAHVHQLVQTGRRLWHKFFVRARTIIGQRTLTKLINRRAFRSPCALQHATTTSLVTPPAVTPTLLCSNSMAPKAKKQTASKKEAKPKWVIAWYICIHSWLFNCSLCTHSRTNAEASIPDLVEDKETTALVSKWVTNTNYGEWWQSLCLNTI